MQSLREKSIKVVKTGLLVCILVALWQLRPQRKEENGNSPYFLGLSEHKYEPCHEKARLCGKIRFLMTQLIYTLVLVQLIFNKQCQLKVHIAGYLVDHFSYIYIDSYIYVFQNNRLFSLNSTGRLFSKVGQFFVLH